jgi:hypothetical protein
MPKPLTNALTYSDHPASRSTVRRQYFAWRAAQVPPLPERCDNPTCVFHTSPMVWCNKPLPTIVEHIDGNTLDNRPKMLRLLCPNCDAQLSDTRGGANRGRIEHATGGYARLRKDGKRDYRMICDGGQLKIAGQPAVLSIKKVRGQ